MVDLQASPPLLYVWLFLRAALSVTFLVAGVSKLIDIRSFRRVIRGYGLLPSVAIGPVSWALPGLEILLALGLVSGIAAPWPLMGVIALLAGFTLAMAVALARGRRDLECGCFGGAAKGRVGPSVFARNSLLLLIGIALLVFARTSSLGWPLGSSQGASLAEGAVILLAATSAVLLANAASSLAAMVGYSLMAAPNKSGGQR